MIQPQELRIGNLVFDHLGRVQKVSETRSDAYICYLSNGAKLKYKLNTTQPIPLTEEILLKFGLKKIDDNLWQYKNGYFIGFYTKRWFIGKYNFDDMVEMITSFEYVHQLQNLFFALTGEELIFKTTP